MEWSGSDEVVEVYSRIQALCQSLGRPPSPPSLRALAIAHIARAEFQHAHDLGAQLLGFAERDQDPVLIVEAHYVLGAALFWLGVFPDSRRHLEQAIAHYEPQLSRTHITLYSQDPKVVCLCRLGLDLWYLGYPNQALQRVQESLILARELAHPFSDGYAGMIDAVLHTLRQASVETRERAEAVIAICHEHHLSYWGEHVSILKGWAVGAQGDIAAGIARMRESMAALQALGAEYMRPYYLALLAELYSKAGNIEQGLTLLAEARALVDQRQERWCEAEVLRIQGELLLMRGEDADADAAFERARAVACIQEAKSLELRAAMRLARLWQKQGKDAEARGMLAAIYGWFTEGFDTPDLRDARAARSVVIPLQM